MRGMQKNKPCAQNNSMKISAYICIIYLIISGICGGVFALFGFNLLYFICFYNFTAYRVALGFALVSALYTAYVLIAFRPLRGMR